jgi:hypothetical protein
MSAHAREGKIIQKLPTLSAPLLKAESSNAAAVLAPKRKSTLDPEALLTGTPYMDWV